MALWDFMWLTKPARPSGYVAAPTELGLIVSQTAWFSRRCSVALSIYGGAALSNTRDPVEPEFYKRVILFVSQIVCLCSYNRWHR